MTTRRGIGNFGMFANLTGKNLCVDFLSKARMMEVAMNGFKDVVGAFNVGHCLVTPHDKWCQHGIGENNSPIMAVARVSFANDGMVVKGLLKIVRIVL